MYFASSNGARVAQPRLRIIREKHAAANAAKTSVEKKDRFFMSLFLNRCLPVKTETAPYDEEIVFYIQDKCPNKPIIASDYATLTLMQYLRRALPFSGDSGF
jgi:hypothetical protein